MKTQRHETDIFAFDNYRKLLEHLYLQNKKLNPQFSYRYFSRLAGLKSPNFLIKVIQGKSNLSQISIDKFIKAFKLNQQEGRFFKHLVLLNQASDFETKERHSEEIRKLRAYQNIMPLKEAQYNYYSKWYFIAVKELVGLPSFRENYEWIANAIVPPITPKQAEEAIRELKALGLIAYDSSQRLTLTNANVTTPDEVISTAVIRYHQDSMRIAAESIARVPREKRDISAVTVGIAKENIAKAKEIISQFRKEILNLSNLDEDNNSVYQLNIQLFPVAEVDET